MSENGLSLLLALLLSHTVADFILQSDAWARQKQQHHFRARSLYWHVGIHMLLCLAILIAFGIPLREALISTGIVGLTHWMIDTLKSYMPAHRVSFFVFDQLLHLLVLVVVWWWVIGGSALPLAIDTSLLWQPPTLLTALAYLLVLRPSSVLIALIMRRWSEGVDTRGTLADAGARIGMLERFLILTFVLSNQMAAIGFLLTAKSVLRFGDLYEDRDRKLTEYVLLGTMLSFSITLTLGLLTRYLLSVL
ncbi:DUF3307 domain-containing protein [Salinicola acroporae]|uniref:DUF3307 domain-containing protein n=1 Tax=Salinicola acroporae TaxID=1541440 RepID=A0ABT6I6I1_9GAMM|nr:DUF3307 domain-containing protein [Salinicola acroporae]MDH4573088.1 DUF3307 domain-containing protein [Salinicola acroporae]